MSSPCSDDPRACITPAVRQWVLSSYLMGKQQASAVALYQLLAPEGSEHGYGNWSSWPEWAAVLVPRHSTGCSPESLGQLSKAAGYTFRLAPNVLSGCSWAADLRTSIRLTRNHC